MLTDLKDFYVNGNEDNRRLRSIYLQEPDEADWEYHPSDLEHYDKVFQKDTLPTYHEMMDYFLLDIWNEYDNDPARYESDEFKQSIYEKVFAYINGRIYGIINPCDNHSVLIKLLQEEYPDQDILELIKEKITAIYDREEEFSKKDALLWYVKEEQEKKRGCTLKDLIIPVLMLPDGTTLPMDKSHFAKFYLEVFHYVIVYYNHMYGGKFRTCFEKISHNDVLVGHPVTSEDLSNSDFHIEDIFKIGNFFYVEELNLEPGENMWLMLASDYGQYFDDYMNPYTLGYVARHRQDGEYYVSAQRGANLYRLERNYYDPSKNAVHKVKWINTLIQKAKGTEAIHSDRWRDIMQCNAVLFYPEEDCTVRCRVMHFSQYKEKLEQLEITIDMLSEHDAADIYFKHPNTFLQLWELMEHTLDLWVFYTVKEKTHMSLLSNIYQHDVQYYKDNSHITYICCDEKELRDSGEVIAVVPRDGISWVYDKEMHTYQPKDIHGFVERKPYLA